MKPFIDECGIIHITYMATAMFLSKEVVTTSGAGGGTHRLLWFQRGGLSVVVGVHVGGESSLPVALVVHGSMAGASLWWAGCRCLGVIIVHVRLWEVLVVVLVACGG